MRTRRARATQRVGVIAAAALIVGSYFTGIAFADDEDGGSSAPSSSSNSSTSSGDNSIIKPLTDLVPGASDITDGLAGAAAADDTTTTSASPTTTTSCALPLPILGCLGGGGTGGSTSPSGPSGVNTVVIYSPYPFPVYGDFGNRYFGRYWDRDCGCDRYASASYKSTSSYDDNNHDDSPVKVATTQVATVPKGGVDTGDGSFQ